MPANHGQNIDWQNMDTATAQLLRAQGFAGSRAGHASPQGRYGNVAQPTRYNGQRYDSKAEARHAAELDMRAAAGELAWILRQVWIPLGPDFRTRVDFLVAEKHDGDLIDVQAHEVKGVETREFARVRRLWPKYGPFRLHVFKRGNLEIIKGKS
jgi:hypothetical protein